MATGTRCGLILLVIVFLQIVTAQANDSWQNLPRLETFASYEDMQNYFDQRNSKSMRQIENPTGDSYLAAFNQHNEQPAASAQPSHSRPKREERQLPSAPRMLRFELSDAVEPSAELRQIVRQYEQRSAKSSAKATVTTTKPKKVRSRRSTRNSQPANFKVEMIPFEASDAREPDAATAKLISRARALDIKKTPATVEQMASSNKSRTRKGKRSRRSAAVQMVKFELSDAKTSLPASLQRTAKQLVEPMSTLLTMETPVTGRQNQSLTAASPVKPAADIDDNLVSSGESAAESNRLYIYKDAPGHGQGQGKPKKSVIGVPQEVHKVITQILKEGGHRGKAFIKYLPAQHGDYERYKVKTVSYSHKPANKYVPIKTVEQVHLQHIPVKTVEQVHLPPVPVKNVEQVQPVQVHIQPVPVVEQLRYVYKPNYAKAYPASPSINQPIVVQEAVPTAAVTEQVHHTYSAELPAVQSVAAVEVPAAQFRPSKPDPLQTELIESSPIYGRPMEQYNNYEVHSDTTSPVIKIEYHAPAENINEHYKQLPEFRELSTLIGKSPDDQIHGLTYLLAKEMQAKLQRNPKQLLVTELHDRPQDSTAPIQFHPAHQQPRPQPTTGVAHTLSVQPGRLIGMAKTKQYVPIVEPGNNDVAELPPAVSSAATKLPTPSSFIDFTPGHGLSSGYEGVHDEHTPVEAAAPAPAPAALEHIIHHGQSRPVVHHYNILSTAVPAQLEEEKISSPMQYVHSHADKALQYASKYAFGYRIRDFHTGNDFGHKQNRDSQGVTRGQYHILLPDGRVQNVIYHADDTGFHADVSFESGKTSR